MTRLGILGGTFDPVHFGHLDAADAARTALTLDGVVFLPSHDPPHRPADPHATAFHRFSLIALAIQDRRGYQVSDLELRRPGPSYTVTTLRELHATGLRPSQIFFIIGADAFAEIATWYQYPAVLECANFAVISRPGAAMPPPAAAPPTATGTGIYHVEARTRDVSSTLIRSRLAAGQPIDDLVPAAVASHIEAHHLYGAAGDRDG
jgi:nicotinate-nucleotide adenylyltransferase